ncbi:MAG TPA: hypothetical protein VHY33_08965, partial [Thermoanaerobaculia bacterium]|nr:hypothetical protein [Thermoanaerobaculia bacterium]
MVGIYRCPNCLGALTAHLGALHCDREDIDYPVVDQVADFMRGVYYDQFDETTILTAEHRQALERENDGAIARINDFYLPLIKGSALRILDAGCGNGISVDLLTAAG